MGLHRPKPRQSKMKICLFLQLCSTEQKTENASWPQPRRAPTPSLAPALLRHPRTGQFPPPRGSQCQGVPGSWQRSLSTACAVDEMPKAVACWPEGEQSLPPRTFCAACPSPAVPRLSLPPAPGPAWHRSPSPRTGPPAWHRSCSLSFVHLFRKTNQQPLPPRQNFTETTEGPSPSRTAATTLLPPLCHDPHGLWGHCRVAEPGCSHRSPLVPEGARPKLPAAFQGVGSEDGQTDDGTTALSSIPCPRHSPQGSRSRDTGRAGQHKRCRQRHWDTRNRDGPGGSTGWVHSMVALLPSRESAGSRGEHGHLKIN